jgi:TPR repeat protein
MTESSIQPEGSSPAVKPAPASNSSIWRNPKFLIAIVTTAGTIVAAYIGISSKETPKEKFTLSGRVYSQNNPGIEGAAVTLDIPGQGVLTKPSRQGGYFFFSDLPPLKGTISVAANGYNVKTLDINPLTQIMEIELIATAELPSTNQARNKPDLAAAREEANMGWWFETGQIGSGPDYDAAMKQYLKAVEHGDVVANWNIARLYERGLGVPQDLEKAKFWYKKAADLGDARSEAALNHLGKNP